MLVRPGSYAALAWLLLAGACQPPAARTGPATARADYAANAALFHDAKAEALRFVRGRPASLPLDLELATLPAPVARHFSRTLLLARQLRLQRLRVAADTTLQYQIAPDGDFIGTRYGWFSYPGLVKQSLTTETNTPLPDGWLYTERTVEIPD